MLSKKQDRDETYNNETNNSKDSKKNKKVKKTIKNYSVSIVIPSSIVDNAQVIRKINSYKKL